MSSEQSVRQYAGLVSYGAYIPRHRLTGDAIRAVLGQGGGKGSRSVAGYDEDTTSMGVEAARRARWGEGHEPRSLHFATTAPAYAERTNATAIHAALALPSDAFASDHAGSPRSSIGALRAAACNGGVAVLSDVRIGRPGSTEEARAGDGAAAFTFGEGDAIAELIGEASVTAEFLDRWRAPGEFAVSTWEERFGLGAYLPLVDDVAGRALGEAAVEAPDHVIVSSPHARTAAAASGRLGGSGADELGSRIGYLGGADLGIRLAAVLDGARPGETILCVSAADGADALVFRATPSIAKRSARETVSEQLALGREIDYATFLTWRGQLRREPPRRPDPSRPQAPPSARAVTWKFGFTGTRCRSCGRVHAPPQRVCAGCGTHDEMDPEPLAERSGTVATFTVDNLAHSLSPPTITAAIDFDGGGRFTCELTDCKPEEVEVGMRVRMTFRRMFTAGGVHNYFWKGTPVRGGEYG